MYNNSPQPPLNKRGSILGTGLSGLVGSRIVELLSDKFDFADLSLDTGVDITDKDQVTKRISSSQAKWIFHLAAKTDVDACETDKSLRENGAAWKINVEGTRNIATAAKTSGKKVLYISTDFVFAGDKGKYTETDTPRPINWYGTTKYEGEKIVLAEPENLVVRITYPYRAKNPTKPDFVHSIIHRLQKNEKVIAVTDQIFTPTLVDDIAVAIKMLLEIDTSGIFHVVGSESLSPYESALSITQTFQLPRNMIEAVPSTLYYQGRASRPYKLATSNAKIKALGVHMHTFSDGLKEIRRQGIA